MKERVKRISFVHSFGFCQPYPRLKIKEAEKYCKRVYFRGLHGREVGYLLLTKQSRVQFLAFPKKISKEKLSMLLRLIKGDGWRKVDSGLKMLIKPI